MCATSAVAADASEFEPSAGDPRTVQPESAPGASQPSSSTARVKSRQI